MEFGVRQEQQHYLPRPGSYAVIFGAQGQVAVMQTSQGYFLPGGGAMAGESPEETLRREVLEECGHEMEIVRALGEAIEYVYAAKEGYIAKQCSFFQTRLKEHVVQKTEDDHRLVWLPALMAMEHLAHRSQAWAVHYAINGSGTSTRDRADSSPSARSSVPSNDLHQPESVIDSPSIPNSPPSGVENASRAPTYSWKPLREEFNWEHPE